MISQVFKEIGWADELGSGVRNLFKYCKAYSGSDPELIEDDIFRFVLRLSETGQDGKGETVEGINDGINEGINDTVNDTVNDTERTGRRNTKEKILEIIRNNPKTTIADIKDIIEVSQATVNRHIRELKKDGRLRREGSDKAGHWEVIR